LLADDNDRLAARRAHWAVQVVRNSLPRTKLQFQACVLATAPEREDQAFDRRIAVELRLPPQPPQQAAAGRPPG
jgi:hypothetical protein